MTTINIPLTTIAANAQLLTGSQTVPVGDNTYTLSINRNVGTQSLDTQTTASILIWADYSLDGGTTWNPGLDPAQVPHYSTTTISGGPIVIHGAQIEVSGEEVFIPGDVNSTLRRIRAGIDNGSVPVSVSGTLVISAT